MVAIILKLLTKEDDQNFMINLYETYNNLIRGVAMKIVRNSDDVDDIEHDVVVKIIKIVDNFKILNKPQTVAYINAITKNTALDLIRKRKKIVDLSLENCVIENLITYDNLVGDDYFDVKTIMGINEKNKNLLYSKYVEKMTVKEMSKKFDMNENAILQALSRARADFKENYRREVSCEK